MAEYNLLTQALLAAGYTVDNFPTDKVKLPGGCYGKSPLENIYGGLNTSVDIVIILSTKHVAACM